MPGGGGGGGGPPGPPPGGGGGPPGPPPGGGGGPPEPPPPPPDLFLQAESVVLALALAHGLKTVQPAGITTPAPGFGHTEDTCGQIVAPVDLSK